MLVLLNSTTLCSRQVQWVRLGDPEPDSEEDDAFPQLLRVAEAIKHPDYKVLQVYNDIALLRLERAPNMTTLHVRPACLQVDRELEKDKLNLIGFGLTEESAYTSKLTYLPYVCVDTFLCQPT
jgi:hypothetical protein